MSDSYTFRLRSQEPTESVSRRLEEAWRGESVDTLVLKDGSTVCQLNYALGEEPEQAWLDAAVSVLAHLAAGSPIYYYRWSEAADDGDESGGDLELEALFTSHKPDMGSGDPRGYRLIVA